MKKQTSWNNLNFIQTFIDLIFPKTCFHCEISLKINERFLCSECEKKLTLLEVICPVCGAPKTEENCRVCETNNFQFDKARSIFLFNEIVQKLIHEFKYNEMTKIAKYFGKYTQRYLVKFHPFDKIDIIAPVPLHKVRKRDRGFNQAELLAKEISQNMYWNCIPTLIRRTRFTETQTKLKKSERQVNVAKAFNINSKIDLKGKNILLVDDVFTTGATTNSIAKVLKEHKADKVYVLTVGRAL